MELIAIYPQLEESGIQVYLSAVEGMEGYREIMGLIEAHVPTLQVLGITEVIHRPGVSTWQNNVLSLSTEDLTIERVRNLLSSLQIASHLGAYFSEVHFEQCQFPQMTWAVNYLQSNLSAVQQRFRTLRFTNQVAAFGGNLMVNVGTPTRYETFMQRLMAAIEGAPLLGAPSVVDATSLLQEEPGHLKPLPEISVGFEEASASPETVPARSVGLRLVDFLRRIELPVQLASLGQEMEVVLARVFPEVNEQLAAEAREAETARQEYRVALATEIIPRFLAETVQGVVLQPSDETFTAFHAYDGDKFTGLIVHVDLNFSITVQRMVLDEEGAWTTQVEFQGVIDDLRTPQ